VVDLDTVIGRQRTEALRSRLSDAPSWSERFVAVCDALVALRRSRDVELAAGIRPELRWAWEQLSRAPHGVSVAGLADEVGWSRRHLGAQFRAEFGVTPRETLRIARFQRARQRLQQPGRPALATVAADTGYADQAHLTREWRRLAGSTPTAWLRDEEFPSVHDQGAVAVAS
jgi:AraC-like DNA-binding protein